jgi:hypothetical protein
MEKKTKRAPRKDHQALDKNGELVDWDVIKDQPGLLYWQKPFKEGKETFRSMLRVDELSAEQVKDFRCKRSHDARVARLKAQGLCIEGCGESAVNSTRCNRCRIAQNALGGCESNKRMCGECGGIGHYRTSCPQRPGFSQSP